MKFMSLKTAKACAKNYKGEVLCGKERGCRYIVTAKQSDIREYWDARKYGLAGVSYND